MAATMLKIIKYQACTMNLYLAKETINSFTKDKDKLLHPKVEKNDLLIVSTSLLHPYDRGLLFKICIFGQN